MRGSGRRKSPREAASTGKKAVKIARPDLTFSNFSIVRLSIPPHCDLVSDLPSLLLWTGWILYLVDQVACSASAMRFVMRRKRMPTGSSRFAGVDLCMC